MSNPPSGPELLLVGRVINAMIVKLTRKICRKDLFSAWGLRLKSFADEN
jgi:hypothetical protein